MLKKSGTLYDGHSLVYFFQNASNIDRNLRQHITDCAYVNQFYLESRYPMDVPMVIEKTDVEDCLRIAEKMLKELNK